MSLDGVCSSLSMILFGGMHMVSERQQITPIHPKQKKNRKQKQIVDMFLSNNRTDCAKRNAQYFLLLLMLMVVAIFLHSKFELQFNCNYLFKLLSYCYCLALVLLLSLPLFSFSATVRVLPLFRLNQLDNHFCNKNQRQPHR